MSAPLYVLFLVLVTPGHAVVTQEEFRGKELCEAAGRDAVERLSQEASLVAIRLEVRFSCAMVGR